MVQDTNGKQRRSGTDFVLEDVENPPLGRNQIFVAFEDCRHPRAERLRRRYRLDAVVEDIEGEWDRILALRHWIHSTIEIEDDNPTKARADAFAILDAALAGGGFHCAHFSIVQHAVLNSFGYVTRRLQCGPGTKENGGNHGVNEVWVNELAKWVLVDAKYDLHFEKDGLPLSALEIRDEVWRDGGASVVPVVGPERKEPKADSDGGTWSKKAHTYRWCAWETNTNAFTSFPAAYTSTLVVLDDEIFKGGTWYRDGRPHWAYGTPFFIRISRRDWIEWTPNVISSSVNIEGAQASIALRSFTPNLRTYQMKEGDNEWRDCEDRLDVCLKSNRHEFSFRTVNLCGIPGPAHRIVIVRK